MSLSPSNILQRLQELKLWQENHEELLKKTKNVLDTNTNDTNLSDYESIEGLSAFDSLVETENSSHKIKNWESQVISPTKPFAQLLEEKLAEDPGPILVAAKPKRPFLKKGSGLERFRITPCPKISNPKNSNPRTRKINSKINNGVTPLKAPDFSVKQRGTWTSAIGKSQIMESTVAHNGLVQQPGEQTLYERALEQELLVFEALEQRANNSSFCSTNSSVLRILSSTPSKIKLQPTPLEQRHVHWESSNEEEEEDMIESNLNISEILQRLRKIAEDKSKTAVVIQEVSDDEKSSTTETSSETTSISSADLEITLKTEKRDVGVCTTSELNTGCPVCGKQIDDKMKEYERKLFEISQDREKIDRIRKKLEQNEREFSKVRRQFDDEKQEFLFDLDTQKKKLLKEKQVFETYMKDSQNRPNKKERTEISNLKQEIAALTETLKLKESKNGMTQARLRNQIKQLEKDNVGLKEEVEKLTIGNAKLNATQKLNRRPSETKILHEINKNITKLTQEALKTKKEEKQNQENQLEKYCKQGYKDSITNSFLDLPMPIQKRVSNAEVQCESESKNPPVDKEMERKISETSRVSDGRKEEIHDDGSKLVRYPNGNVKTISPEGNLMTMKYYNGDIKETNQLLGTVKYFFNNEKIWQTTFNDGTEYIEFPTGIKEKRSLDGKCQVFLPDDVVQTTFPDGTQETTFADGSKVQITKDGERILFLANGQKEIETKEYKRREYPDGTMKILYPDGTQETRYKSGRIRIKDKNGTLVVDTHS